MVSFFNYQLYQIPQGVNETHCYHTGKRQTGMALLNEFGPHRLFYQSTNATSGSAIEPEKQVFEIDGRSTPFSFHPLTLKKRKKVRARAQLSSDHMILLGLPLINENAKDVTEICFPNGTVSLVMLARRNSPCSSLRRLHEYVRLNGARLDDIISSLAKNMFLSDDMAGGQYIVSGYGNLGRNTKRHPPDQPAMRGTLQAEENMQISEIVGGALSCVADCADKYCDWIYHLNRTLKNTNVNLQWPPQGNDCFANNWMSTQFVVRRWGAGLRDNTWPLENMIVSAHVDRGDLDTIMPSIYYMGGSHKEGGVVAGSDLALFEKETGGSGVQIKTCIEDTVVVVLSNSRRQLHGCIKNNYGSQQKEIDPSAWSTRIIPYIPKGVFDWMKRNPKATPWNETK